MANYVKREHAEHNVLPWMYLQPVGRWHLDTSAFWLAYVRQEIAAARVSMRCLIRFATYSQPLSLTVWTTELRMVLPPSSSM